MDSHRGEQSAKVSTAAFHKIVIGTISSLNLGSGWACVCLSAMHPNCPIHTHIHVCIYTQYASHQCAECLLPVLPTLSHSDCLAHTGCRASQALEQVQLWTVRQGSTRLRLSNTHTHTAVTCKGEGVVVGSIPGRSCGPNTAVGKEWV